MKPSFIITLVGLIAISLLTACNTVPEKKRVELKCQAFLLDYEKIACYKEFIQTKITRSISTGTRHLTSSDWPFEYAIRVNISLDSGGKFKAVDMLQRSTSRQLNQKILQTIKRIEELPVPEASLFQQGDFSILRLLIKPARKPILGGEKRIDSRLMIIYLPGPCATRSQHC